MKTHLGVSTLVIALAGAVALVGGCDKAQDTSAPPKPKTSVGTAIDDTVVTAAVKSALLADANVKSFDLKVETRKGEVQLSGFVESQVQIDRAIAVARGVSGVKEVDNKMALKGAPTTVGNKVDDGIVTTKVKSALLADANIKSFDIAVVTRKGQVQLSGFADSQAQIDRAMTVAKGVQGVTGVENSMSLKQGERTVGAKVDDGIVTAKVKSALLADPSVKALDITVATNKGQVQLSGYVDSKSQMDQAVLLARGVVGVTGVESRMSLKK